MSEEELIETLKEFEKNRVEKLKEPSRNLFYAIMKIADERDKYKEVLDKIKEKLEKDNKEAVDFTHKIETSDLQQGNYPVHYYRMLWNKELTEKYLELLEEIE